MKNRRRSLLAGLAAVALSALAVPALGAQAYTPTPQVLYQLPSGTACLKGTGNCIVYPKATQLPNGRLVAAFEDSRVPASGTAIGQRIPVYKSDDNGTTWQSLASVEAPAFLSDDPAYAKYTSNWTNPYLYVLPQDVGDLQQGTLLLASVVSGQDYWFTEHKAADPNWIPDNDGDRSDLAIALYSSTDDGASWEFVNIVARGGWQGGSAGAIGRFSTVNSSRQVDPLWEPYLMVHDDELVAYYSDENDYLGYDPTTGEAIVDPDNATAPDSTGQILAHRTWGGTASTSWSPTVVDVSGLTDDRGNGKTQIGGGRPGMTNVVPTTDGRWMMTFEYFGGGANVRFKMSDDPLRFWADGTPGGEEISRGDGAQGALPFAAGSRGLSWGGSPVVIRTGDGRLVYNAAGSGDVWVNESGASTGVWTQFHTTVGGGYSRNLTYDRQTGRVVILQSTWGGANATSFVNHGEVDLGDSAGTYYQLVNRKTGQVLGTSGRVNDDQFNNWTPGIRLEAAGSAADPDTQYWHISRKADGVSLLNKSGGRAAVPWGDATGTGTRVAQWVDQSEGGVWNLVDAGDGFVRLQLVANTSRYATGSANGASITLQNAATDGSQDWRLVPLAPTAASLTPDTQSTDLIAADPVGAGATIVLNAAAADVAGNPLHANTIGHVSAVAADGTVTALGDVSFGADQTGSVTLPASIAVGATVRLVVQFDDTAAVWDSATVQPAAVITPGTPAISGTPTVGGVLTADAGTWTPADVGLAYQWSADGAAIAGATGSTYSPTSADIGRELTVTVTATKAGYPTATASSAKSAPVQGVITAGTPVVSGTPVVGSALTVAPGAWSPSDVTLSYQWSANGSPIPGATGSSYAPAAADAGKTLTVTVTGVRSGYITAAATSVATAAVASPTMYARSSITSADQPTADGWYQQSVVVALSAPQSNQRVQYSVNGAAWRTSTQSISVTASGTTVIATRLLDRSNSVIPGTASQVVVKIDKTLPTTSVTRDPNVPTGTPLNPLSFTFAGTDSHSGVASVTYRVNDGAWATAGSAPLVLGAVGDYVISYRSTDAAGNVGTTKSVTASVKENAATTVKPSVATVKRGAHVTFTVAGFARWDAVQLSYAGTTATVMTDVNGSAKVTVTIPADASAGATTVTATGSTGAVTATTRLTVK